MTQTPQLERDPSCLQDLSWRITGSSCIDELKDELQARDWQSVSPCPKVLIFRNAEADEFVLIPRTGRIQLRVSYLLPRDARAEHAQKLFRQFFDR